MMKVVNVEQYIERLDCDVYPVTLLKFLLNKRKILNFFSKVAGPKFNNKYAYKIDSTECEACNAKKDLDLLCREHTSINRILTAEKVIFDLDTNTYFYKNEIFREVDGKIVIFYCPHTKLIKGNTTDSRVRRINGFVVDDDNMRKLPDYQHVSKIVSSDCMENNMKAWFNYDFSIITQPVDRASCNWCLVANY